MAIDSTGSAIQNAGANGDPADPTSRWAPLEADGPLRAKLRRQLREARGAVLADAEGFEVVVFAIEAVGRVLCPQGKALNEYNPKILEFVKETLGWADRDPKVRRLEAKLFLLRQTRNDYLHEGVHARNAADEAVEVALLLEDALCFNWSEVRLEDVMVRRPVTADADDTLAEIRRTMLSYSFSFIPVRLGDGWRLVSERWLASQIVGMNRKRRDITLARKIGEFAAELPLVRVLSESTATNQFVGTKLPDLILVAEPDNSKSLLGVVSPSDFL